MFEELKKRVIGTAKLFKESFSEGLLNSLKTKNILIPESVIQSQLSDKLAKSKITLNEFKCVDEGMKVHLFTRKIGATLHYKALIVVEVLEITQIKHQAIVKIESDELSGKKIWGKVVAMLIRLFINSIVSLTIFHSDMNTEIQYDEKSRKANIDLRTIPEVDKLYKEQKILGSKRMIDLIQITSVNHERSGIRIHFESIAGEML